MRVKGFRDTINWYEENAKEYAKAIENLSSPEQINDFVALLPDEARVLDAGCAAGRDSKLLSNKGLRVTGIDLSKNLIKIAKRKYPDIKFIIGDFLKLPFPVGCFDGVWAHASLLHFETVAEVKGVLREFSRVLKKNGIIHLLVKAQTDKKKFTVVKNKLSKHNRFFQFFTKEEVQELLQEANFEIVNIEQYKEIERNPKGRPEVEWILALGEKGRNR